MISEKPEPILSQKRLVVEVTAVFTLQLAILLTLFQVSRIWSLQGALHALVGAVFVFLPVLVLDRTGRPYERYGLSVGRPHIDSLWAAVAMLITFVPIVFALRLFPAIWDVEGRAFGFVWPPGYVTVAASHLLVVALPEEFFYRGYLLGRLNDIFPQRVRVLGVDVGPGWLIQAALFAIGHFVVDLNPARLAVFFPALVFGWLRLSRGSIAPAVLYHACANIFMDLFRAGYGL